MARSPQSSSSSLPSVSPVGETSSFNLSSKLENLVQGTPTTAFRVLTSKTWHKSRQLTTLPRPMVLTAFSTNTAIWELIKRKSNDETTAVQFSQTVLKTAFFQNHAHNVAINEPAISSHPHDTRVKVRVHNLLTVSAALAKKAQAKIGEREV